MKTFPCYVEVKNRTTLNGEINRNLPLPVFALPKAIKKALT
jgi:hypothetical protein